MRNENLSKKLNFNQKDFDDILIQEITIKKSSRKYVKQFLKSLQQPNQYSQLVMQESYEKNDKQSQDNQIQKSSVEIIDQQNDQLNVQNYQIEKQLDNQQQQEEINISDSLVQGQHKYTLKNGDEMHKNIQKTTHCTFQDNQSSQYTKNSHIECSGLESQIKCIKEEWNIQIFDELNINSHLSQNFKNNQDQIFQELQKKRYYLLNKLNLSQNEEVFEGYQPSEQISSNGVCSLYYFAVIHDLNEKDFNQKMQKIVQLKVNNVNFLVDQIEVTQSTKILVLQRQYEFYVDNQNLQQSNLCIYEVCENTKKQQQEEINISANLVQGQHKDTLKNTDEMHKTIRKITHFTFQDNQSSQYTKNNHIECSDLESKIRFTKEEWNIQIFEELNINSHLSQNFKNNQDQIFQELQKKRYYLLDKLNLSQNEEVFEGYQPSEQISSNGVCSLYYFVVIHDLNEKDFNQKMQKTVQLKVNNVNFLVHQIEVIDFLPQDFRVCWNNNDYQLLDILGDLFYNLREYENSLKFYNQSLEIKQKIYSKFSIDIAFTLGNIGLESLEIAKQVYKNNNPEIIDFYLQVGEIKRHFSKNDDVQIYYLKALELVRKKYNQSKYLIAVILFKIGFEFKDYNQGELSLQYFLESLEEFKTLFKESNINIANNLFQIGTVYFQYQDFKNALKYFLEYRDMRQQLNYIQYDDYYFQSLEFIVKCYQFINDPILAYKTSLENFQLSKKYNRNKDEIEKSLYLFVKNCNEIENYKQALLFRIESLEQNQFYEKNLLRIGNLYELLGDFSISIEYYKQIIINLDYIQQQFVVKELDSEESGDENELAREIYLEGFWNLGLCYKQMNLHKKSLKYFQKLYNLIKDKNITKEYLKQILNEIIYCFQKLQDEKSSQFYIKKLRQSEQKDSFLLRDLVEIRDLLEKEQFF
ncbi:hypothetical protein ABPG74_019188 [Tetrahymena malaccensis]